MYPFFEQLFIDNYLVGIAYAEPYAGGAGLALRLLYGGLVSRVLINDLDPAIYAFWTAVLEHTEEFCSWISKVDITVDQWHRYKAIQSMPTDQVDPLDLAKSTYFLNRTNVSGVLKGGVIGGKEQKGRYSVDARFRKRDDLIKRIETIRSYAAQIAVSSVDGVEFVERLGSQPDSVFVYADPPYVRKGAKLYLNAYTQDDHTRLAGAISKLKKHWVVSYDDHSLIRRLFAGHKMVSYRIAQSTSNRVGDELFIFSDRINGASSMPVLNGAYVIPHHPGPNSEEHRLC